MRAALFTHFSSPVEDSSAGVNLAQHILNTVDIPKGVTRENTKGALEQDYTQWVVIKDLSNRTLYFRTYENLDLRVIDLKKLNFEPGAPKKSFTFGGGDGITDITEQLKRKEEL